MTIFLWYLIPVILTGFVIFLLNFYKFYYKKKKRKKSFYHVVSNLSAFSVTANAIALEKETLNKANLIKIVFLALQKRELE